MIIFRLLEAEDVDQWSVQDGLYLRYNAAHARFEGATVASAVTSGVVLAPTSSTENLIVAQNASTVPLTLRGAAGQSADGLQIQDSNGGNLVQATPQGNLIASGGLTASGSLLVVQSSELWGSALVHGPLTAAGALTASGQVTAGGALQVWGAASLLGNLSLQGSANLNGLVAGPGTLNSLTVTGATALLSGASVTGAVAITAPTLGRCLTLNSDLAATIFVNPASGTQRANLRLPTFQIISDSLLNGTRDLIFQNLSTGRSPIQLGADDRVTLGVPGTVVMVSGNLGVGVAAQHPLHLLSGKVESWFDNSSTSPQIIRGWVINKPDPTDGLPHGINWCVSGTVYWQIGQDFDTLDGGGNSDFVICYDALANSGAGADILRFCPANTNPYRQTLCSLGINGTPRTSSSLLLLRPVAYRLGGLGMVLSGGIALDAAYDQTSAALQNIPLVGYRFGGTSQNIFTQRWITLAQIANGATSGTRSYLLMNGALSGTATTPLFNSSNTSFGPTFGIEGTDTSLSLFTAPVGNNQSPIYGLAMDTAGNLAASGRLIVAKTTTLQSTLSHQGSQAGFFGASPVARPAVSGNVCGIPAARTLAAALGSLGLITDNTAGTDPNATSFSWVNQGSASVTGGNGRLFLNAPASSGDALRLQVVAVPTGAYTLTVGLLPMAVNANFTLAGLCLYNSTSGGVVTFAYTNNSVLLASAPCITVSKWNSTGSFSANYATSPATIPAANWQAGPCLWFRIQDDGTSRICSLSTDGVNFFPIHSVGRTDFLTPTHLGFFADANSSLYAAGITLVSWQVTTP